MADILAFPPQLRAVPTTGKMGAADSIEFECRVSRRRHIAQALEHVASANIDLAVDNLVGTSGFEGVSDETMIGIAQALVHVIDAMGSRNADLPLRRALTDSIERLENTD